ncbi:hypothetical protein FOCC_FOCC001048 [Frankliniella occidentalis]|nr:hypothetical protein FOCC_FOCC001048 [Frankliniella occidentalis]
MDTVRLRSGNKLVQNRLKKKKYMADLENELQALRRENSKLKLSLDGYSKDVQLVRKENKYLRNVLANSKEISHLLRSINVNCGSPSVSSVNTTAASKKSTALKDTRSNVIVESAVPTMNIHLDSLVPSTDSSLIDFHPARTVRRDFPIAVDDVPLSLSAPEDEDTDDLDILFGSKEISTELDLNLNEAPCDDDFGFGPNAFGDWLDGDEPLANIGVCLHVANKKVSLEFCSSCNENAFSSCSGAPLLCSLEGLQFYLPIAEAIAKHIFTTSSGPAAARFKNWFSIDRKAGHMFERFNRFGKLSPSIELRSIGMNLSSVKARFCRASHMNLLSYSWTLAAAAPETSIFF